jgi:membrane protein required for colicin V production
MNWLDFVILAFIGIPALLGFKTGMVKALANLGGIIVGIILAVQFNEQAGDLIGLFIEDEGIARPLGFIAIIAATMVVAWIAAAFVKRVLSLLLLGWVDRAGGVAFGALVGSTFVSVILFLLDIVPMSWADGAITGSTLKPYFDVLVNLISDVSGDIRNVSL